MSERARDGGNMKRMCGEVERLPVLAAACGALVSRNEPEADLEHGEY